jgi:hypothetical protein
MTVRVDSSLEGIDWEQAKADLAPDDFDNGRSPQALWISFAHSQHVAIARDGDHVVGMARLLSDGVCNAYLLDVWTLSAWLSFNTLLPISHSIHDSGQLTIRPREHLMRR